MLRCLLIDKGLGYNTLHVQDYVRVLGVGNVRVRHLINVVRHIVRRD